MSQMENWLTNDDVQRLVVVVTGIDSGETLERWQFNVCIEDGSGGVEVSVAAGGGKNNENVAHNIIEREGGDEKKKMKHQLLCTYAMLYCKEGYNY